MENKIDIPPIRRSLSQLEAGALPRTYIWRSCCLDMDSRAILFVAQLLISLAVLVVSMYSMLTSNVCYVQWISSTTISFILGLWLPSPRMCK